MTAQVRDSLIYNNQEIFMAAEPLKEFLKDMDLAESGRNYASFEEKGRLQ